MIDMLLDAPALESSLEAYERLLAIDSIPAEVVLAARRGQTALAPTLASLIPATAVQPLRIALPGGWSLSNPSIALAAGGFRVIGRASNISTGVDGVRRVTDANSVTRAAHFLIDLSPDLSVRGVNAIVDPTARPEPPVPTVTGLDDARLACHRRAWWLTATVPARQAGADPEVALARLDGLYLTDVHLLLDRTIGAPPWAPVLGPGTDTLLILASLTPTRVFAWDAAASALASVATQPAPFVARHLRMSSQVIACGDGYLGLAHDAVVCEDGRTGTTHRWVWFDADWTLTRLSRPFVWRGAGSEVASGLARRGENLVVSLGVDQCEAWLAVTPLDNVLDLLDTPLDLDQDAIARLLAADPILAALRDATFAERAAEQAPAPTTIVSWTISGNSADIIGDALRSVVDWVDWCVLVDTGITDDTIDVARSIVGDKLIVDTFPWRDDFSAARNFALARAADTGATWAVCLDTDERILTNGVDIRHALTETTEPVLLAPHSEGVYTKDRFFRLPVSGEFRGPTHEAFYRPDVFGGATATLPGVVFDELDKSNEQFRQKFERDRRILSRHVRVEPDEPRWFYYWGDALQHLGRHEEAIRVFRACADLPAKWDEESAWAMYRAAQSLVELGRKQEALEACAYGMTKHAGISELSWYAAYIAWQMGLPQQAVYWARQSIAVGNFGGVGPSIRRLGWKLPFATWEGPYDVLRFALREIGDEAGAAEAERLYQEAAQARTRSQAPE